MQNNEIVERLLALADRLVDYMGEGATNEEDERTHQSYIETLHIIKQLTTGETSVDISTGEVIDYVETGKIYNTTDLKSLYAIGNVYAAKPIDGESWLHTPGYEKFVDAYNYAMLQTKAIRTLSEISPEGLFNTMWIILHKMGFDFNEMSRYV